MDAEIKDPPPPLVGAQGYRRFLLSKPVLEQDITVHAASADSASEYLVSAFPIHSSSFPPNLSGPQQWNNMCHT